MKKYKRISAWILILFFTFSSLAATPQPAQASGLDDVLSIVKQILDIAHMAGASSLPTGDDVDKAYTTLKCIADGEDVIFCTATYTKNIDNEYVGAIIDLYIAVNNEDIWAILGIVGDVAPCVIIDIFTGGTGGALCDLVKELAKAIVAAINAIGEFFSDLGEAISDISKAISCFFNNCSDNGPPPPPPEQVIYTQVFQPKLAEGLTKIKDPDPYTFQQYLFNLENSAYSTVAGLLVSRHINFQYQDVWQIIYVASDAYRKNVHALWDTDMVKTQSELAAKRIQYANPKNLDELNAKILAWVKDYGKLGNTPYFFPPQPFPLAKIASESCRSDFKAYAHVDRWIAQHPAEAQNGGMITSTQWCSDYATQKAEMLTERIMALTPENCPLFNQKYRCTSLESYAICFALKGLIGQNGTCSFNIPIFGTKVAQEIDSYLKNRGADIPCQIIVDDNNPGTDLPVRYLCTRPKQEEACHDGYAYYKNIPVNLFQCDLRETADYKKLRERVQLVVSNLRQGRNPHPTMTKLNKNTDPASYMANKPGEKPAPSKVKTMDGAEIISAGTATDINKSGPETLAPVTNKVVPGLDLNCDTTKIAVAKGDPLIVEGASCIMQNLKRDPNQDMGFGPPSLKPGFEYRESDPSYGTVNPPQWATSMDGVSTPVFIAMAAASGTGSLLPVLPPQDKRQQPDITLGNALDKLKNPDPIDQGSLDSKTLATLGKPAEQGITSIRTLDESKDNFVGLSPGAIAGIKQATDIGQIDPGTQTTPMSGTLPTSRKSGSETRNAQTDMITALNPPKPDITSADQLKIGGLPAFWDRPVIIDAARAISRNKNGSGLCEFEIEYSVRNIGAAEAGTFRSRWANNMAYGLWTQIWPPIVAGAMKTAKTTLSMKPGMNVLSLTLDDLGQLKESNTANNKSTVNVQVSGSCGTLPPAITPGPPKLDGGTQNPIMRR
jgi:hypothetical protein